MSTLGTIETVIQDIGIAANDLSIFAPPGVSNVMSLLGVAAPAVAAVLKAIDDGANPNAVTSAVEASLKAASDAQMKAELK